MDSAAPAVAVRIRGLKKGFGEGHTRIEVLHGMDLDVYQGEMLLLVGPSGCGKTTLLCLIASLLDPDAGSIEVFGQAVEKMSIEEKTAYRRRDVGFVFQQYNLIPTLTAAENAAIPRLIQRAPRRTAVGEAVALLEKVGVGERTASFPATLSGGELQRVAIARALIGRPRLLICDEPTASLDGDTGQQVMETLRATALRPDRCIIVVTHDSRVFPFGHRIARMLDGRILSVEKVEGREIPADGLGAAGC